MACNDRQLTQAQREAAYQQQRTGVARAVRPFSGSATLQNIIDYLNRELVPGVRQIREATNDVYLQVADNAPSANPLGYYFATSIAAGDPTTGRVKLDNATQNLATTVRVSQSNARLQDVTPWLDVMAGGVTTPLGVVTLTDAINPGRFLRFDLNTIVDQGAYWDMGVTIIESSDSNPFVDGEAVVIGFIASVSAAGSTIPVSAISPIATDTFIGNITGSAASPSAVPLASVDSTSVAYDAASHEFRRAALTGAIAASANSNATLFAGILDNGSAEIDRTNLNFVSTTSIISDVGQDAGNDEMEINMQRAALTGAIAAAQNSNATVFSGVLNNGVATTDRAAMNFVSTTSVIADVGDDAGNQEMEVNFQRAALTGEVTAAQNVNATVVVRSTDFQTTPWTGNHQFSGNLRLNGTFEVRQRTDLTLSADADDVDMSANNVLRIVGNGFQLTGMVPLSPGNGQTVQIFNADSADPLIIAHDDSASTAANRFFCPNSEAYTLAPRTGVWAKYDDSSDRWFLLANTSPARLIRRHTLTSDDSSISITPNDATTWFRAQFVAAGGGGGGADADIDESCVGGGGGAGGYNDIILAIVSGNITGSVGNGGTAGSNTGGTGGTGGNTVLTYNSTSHTANGGTGGTGCPTGSGAFDGSPRTILVASGDGGAPAATAYAVTGGDGFGGFAIALAENEVDKAAEGGNGGPSFFGGGGSGGSIAATTGASNGTAGRAAGSGGGGGARIGTGSATTGATGGAGADGAMIIEEWAGPVPTQGTIS